MIAVTLRQEGVDSSPRVLCMQMNRLFLSKEASSSSSVLKLMNAEYFERTSWQLTLTRRA